MPNFVCTTCGTQYAGGDRPPDAYTVCQAAFRDYEQVYIRDIGG
jgi:hypothetical protein